MADETDPGNVQSVNKHRFPGGLSPWTLIGLRGHLEVLH